MTPGRVQFCCLHAGCPLKIVQSGLGKAIACATVGGWKRDQFGWWCDEHAHVDTISPPSLPPVKP